MQSGETSKLSRKICATEMIQKPESALIKPFSVQFFSIHRRFSQMQVPPWALLTSCHQHVSSVDIKIRREREKDYMTYIPLGQSLLRA